MSSPLNNFRKVVNKKKINEQTIEDLNGKPTYEVIDLIKPERMKGSVKEDIKRIPIQYGNVYYVCFMWRGMIYNMKLFFPQIRKPTRKDVEVAIRKVYPSAILKYYDISSIQPGDPYINVGK